MALGTKSDFTIYEAQFVGAFTEVAMQFADAFNEASRGALVLGTQGHRGDFRHDSFYNEIASLVKHRDPTTSAAATPDGLSQGEIVGVKVNKRTYVAQSEDAFYKINQTPAELGRVAGQQQAVAVQVDRVNRACWSLIGSIGAGELQFGTGKLIYDGTTGVINHSKLNSGIALFGDRGNSLTFIVMHSKVWYDLVGQAITTDTFETQAFAIRTGMTATLGRPVLVTDSPALVVSGTPDTYRTLVLSAGALITDQSEPLRMLMERKSGNENIEIHRQTEWADTITAKGYLYTGTANPGDDGTNGTPASVNYLSQAGSWAAGSGNNGATDLKSTAGVIINTQ